MPKFPQYAFSYDVHELIAYRQTALPSVCPAFYPRSNVCLFVPVAAYDHLSLRPCIRMSPSVCSCSRIWSSVCPNLYPHVPSVGPCIPMWPSVSLCPCIVMLPSVCSCIRIWSSVCPTLYLHVTVCSPLFPRMIVSLSVLLAAYYHGEFDVSEPNEESHLGSLCTHGSQLIMQMYYAIYSRVWHKICNTAELFGTTEQWGSYRAISLIQPCKLLPSFGWLSYCPIVTICLFIRLLGSFNWEFTVRIFRKQFVRPIKCP